MMDMTSGIDFYSPTFNVELAKKGKKGKDISGIPRNEILSIEIDEDIESPASFKISINESIKIETQKFVWLNSDSIAPGNEVIISFGYASSKNEALFRGRIKALTPGFLSSGMPSLSVEGYDLSMDLQKTQGRSSYTEMAYSDIVSEIASENGLIAKGVDPTITVIPNVKRENNQNDYDFIREKLAKKILGFEFFVRDNVLYFRKPADVKDSAVNFNLRANIISFNPRMSVAGLVNEVNVNAWDEKNKQAIKETVTISDIKSSVGIPDFDSMIKKYQGKKITINIQGKSLRNREEAKQLAIAELKRRNNGFITGSLECIGNPELRPGMTVNINKVGDLFSGVYYITKAKHVISDSGYRTTLDIRRCVF
jgi:phage protein D